MLRAIINDSQLNSSLRLLKDLTRNLAPALLEIGKDQLDSVKQTFDVEGRPDKWKELAEWTKRSRAKRGTWPGKILQDTGKLLASWNYALIQDGVSIGTPDPRSKILNNSGTNDKGFFVPARPMNVVMPEDIEKHVATLNKKIQEALK